MATSPWLKDWLTDQPQARFFGELANKRQSFTPGQSSYWGGQYGNIYNRYLGQLGQTAMQGQVPSQTFGNFMSQFPWERQWGNLPRWQRGYNERAFSPSMRWLMY